MTTSSRARVAVAGLARDGVLLAPAREPTRVLELVGGALVLFAWSPPGVPGFLSVGLLTLTAGLAVASVRRPPRRLEDLGLGWLAPVLVLVLAYLVLASLTTPDTSVSGWPRRALRLASVGLFLLVLVSGRLHYPSLVRGMALGAVGNYVLFVAGVAPAPYGQYLSGYYLDKNQAGLVCVVVGLLLTGLVERRSRQVLVLLATSWLVWETGSRTSLAALACAVAWIVLRPRVQRTGRVVLGVALAAGVQVLETSFSRVGTFADRFGSDVLRERIDDASRLVLERSPVQGAGLGEAYVVVDENVFFFHNSYWTALVEGGWVLAAGYVAVTVLLGVGLLRPGRDPGPWVAAEAANVAVLVCALRLGEVFGTTVATTALAGGILGLLAHRARTRAVDREAGAATGAVPAPVA